MLLIRDAARRGYITGYFTALVLNTLLDAARAVHIPWWAMLPLVFAIFFTAQRWAMKVKRVEGSHGSD